jgi:hypothetical protein
MYMVGLQGGKGAAKRLNPHSLNIPGVWIRNTLAAALAFGLLLGASPGSSADFTVIGPKLQERVNGALAMMQYAVSPDVTSSSLSINSGEGGTNGIFMTQFGGGFTWSKSVPLYLEGNAAFSRYDPVFIASNGTEQRRVPAQWDTITGTVGVGWDFPIAKELVLRPIGNFMLGRVTSDVLLATRVIEGETGKELEFLKHGMLDAVGYGGSLMLDYEHYREEYEIDVEARVTNVWMQSFGGTSEAVQGSALAQSASLWTRWRAPTKLRALDRPVRYVAEYAFTRYFGPNGDMLGFNNLNSIGAGLELDASALDRIATRWRLIGRFRFGENVRGWGVGLGISF